MTSDRLDRVLRVGAILLAAGCGAVGIARSSDVLFGGGTWLAFLVVALSGLGYLVVRVSRVAEPAFGLRVVWGIAALLAVAGVLVGIGVCNRFALLGIVGIGFSCFAWRELVSERPLLRALADGVRAARTDPGIALIVILLGAVALLQIVGAVARLDRNPWDDDISYTPLVRRLLDVGDLNEPFSFRRMAAYGGQTVLQALAGARGTLANVHLADRALGLLCVWLLFVDHARSTSAPRMWSLLGALLLLLLPDISINTASYWTGAALVYGMYRTLPHSLVIAALVGAATCTLRQNYIPFVLVFLALSLVWQRADRKTWGLLVGVGALSLMGWWIAAYRSNGTFLFPLIDGTWNDSLSLGPSAMSWLDHVAFLVACCIETTPIAVVPVLFLVLATLTDRRPGRPLWALFLASIVAFVLLAWSFSGADAFSIWRYAFAFATPLTLALVLDATNEVTDHPVALPSLGRWVLLAALLLQLFVSRTGTVKRHVAMLQDAREAIVIGNHGDPNAHAEARRHEAMQAAIPAGARVLAMVDDAAFLDFARNDIAVLDTPGFASPGAGLPTFCGPAAWRAYLLGQGFRYVTFVRPDRSRYFYRRTFWIWRLFNDSELFQTMSLYTIDAIDTLFELSRGTNVVYQNDGFVVMDLGERSAVAPSCPVAERLRRDDARRAILEGAGLGAAWSLFTRDSVVFLDGMSNVVLVDGTADPEWMEQQPGDSTDKLIGTPARWVHRRAHIRLRGAHDMHLRLRGNVRLNALHARPRLDVSLGGRLLSSVVTDENGGFIVELDVAASALTPGWADLYVVFSTSGTPEKDIREVRVARLLELTWEKRSP